MPRSVAALLLAALLVLCHGARVVADDDAIGVILAVSLEQGATPLNQSLLGSTEAADEVRWRLEHVAPAPPQEAPTAPALLDELEMAWSDADFTRCTELAREPGIDPYRLLANGNRMAAARAGFLSAACAHRLPDPDRAFRQIDRLFVLSLDEPEALSAIRAPDFLELVEEVRSRRASTERRAVTVQTIPDGARVSIDGGAHQCDASPCTFPLEDGEHVVVAERLGLARREIRREVHSDTEQLRIELDPASAEEAERQLAAALRDGRSPGETPFAQTAAAAHGADVLVVVFVQEGTARAVFFEAAAGRVTGRSGVRGGEEELPLAVRTAITEWAPAAPVWPWITAGAATAVAVGIAVFFLLQPEDEFVFELR